MKKLFLSSMLVPLIPILFSSHALAYGAFDNSECINSPVEGQKGRFRLTADTITSFNYSDTHPPNLGTNLVEIVFRLEEPIKVGGNDWYAVQISFRPKDNPPRNRTTNAIVDHIGYPQCGYFHFVTTTNSDAYCDTVKKAQTCDFAKDDVFIEFDPQKMEWYTLTVQPKK